MSLLNEAIVAAGGPRNCLTSVAAPSIRHATETMRHRGTQLIVATGGPAVVRAALEQPKRAICAGPGNPPAVVDETADLGQAARALVDGCGFDNNLPCIGEKSCVVLAAVADDLIRELRRVGGHEVSGAEAQRLSALVMPAHGDGHEMNRSLVGRDAAVILRQLGRPVAGDPPSFSSKPTATTPACWKSS
jgi:acyl-CoA reductase-like NAD-dependent aldehyde dehydrogenase